MKKNITKEQVRAAVNSCRLEGVLTSVYFLIGSPWESEATFRETVDFAKQLEPDFVEFFYAYPFEGTEMYVIAANEGLLERGQFPLAAYSKPAIPSKYLTMERISEMRSEALRSYYLRWSVISKTLKRARSPRVFINYAKLGLRQVADLVG